MTAYKWRLKDGTWGKEFQVVKADEMRTSMFNVWEDALKAREHLIENVTDYDSELAEKVIETESFDNISSTDLREALRRITLDPDCKALVTLIGSSYTNVGVQPLIDGIIQYCPSPADRDKRHLKMFGSNFCGLVFKIIHHPMKGVLSFVRVYTGKLSSKDTVYNLNQKKTEKFTKLYLAFADEFLEAGEVEAGNIVVLAGLKLAQTGDTLVLTKSVANSLEVGEDEEGEEDQPRSGALLGPLVPEPVVFSSVEPPSLAQQKQFEVGLCQLAREDPSLRVTQDQETGQTVLGGMGELHLEIVRDRMLTTYKVEVELGKLQVAYREAPDCQLREELTFTRQLGDRTHSLTLDLEVETFPGGGRPRVVFSKEREAAEQLGAVRPKQLRKVEAGLMSGLESGPLLSFPVTDCLVTVHGLTIARSTQDTMILAGCSSLVRQLLSKATVRLAEPIMLVEVTTGEDMVGTVVQDFISRRGNVLGTTGLGEVSCLLMISLSTVITSELCGEWGGSPSGAEGLQQAAEDRHEGHRQHQHAAQPLPSDVPPPPGPCSPGRHGLLTNKEIYTTRCLEIY